MLLPFGAGLGLVLFLVLLGLKIYVLVSALSFPAEAFTAAGKLTKQGWGIILGIGVAAELIFGSGPVSIVNLAFTVAAIVYLVDVRPALREVLGR